LNGHVRAIVYHYIVYSKYFGEKNVEYERVFEFCNAMEMAMENTCFKKPKNTVVIYVPSD